MTAEEQRIVLVNPNFMKPPIAPLAFDYLNSACAAAGVATDLVDCALEEPWEKELDRALGRRPLLVGVTIRNVDDSYFASQDFTLRHTLPILEKIREKTDTAICLGGIGFSIFPRQVMEFCDVPFGIQGDGEEGLVGLVRALAGYVPLGSVPGLIQRKDGQFQENGTALTRLERHDLSSRSLVDNRYYFRKGGQIGFETKRGCSCACTCCPEPAVRGKQVRVRDPANIVLELRSLLDQGVDVLHTCDCEFNVPRSHAVDVSRAIIHAGLGDRIAWYAYCTPEGFDDELAAVMRRAGCVGVDFCADHGNDEMLRRLGKSHTRSDLERTRNACANNDLLCMFDLLLGAPGDSRQGIAESISLMKNLRPERIGISLGVRLYPNTAITRHAIHSDGRSLLRSGNPHLFGVTSENDSLLQPIYFCEADLGDDIEDWLHDLIGDDPGFLLGRRSDTKPDYNYNDNPVLTDAIERGCRGAYWDILRRLSLSLPE